MAAWFSCILVPSFFVICALYKTLKEFFNSYMGYETAAEPEVMTKVPSENTNTSTADIKCEVNTADFKSE